MHWSVATSMHELPLHAPKATYNVNGMLYVYIQYMSV